MGVVLPNGQPAVDGVHFAALVTGDDAGRHAGGAHRHGEGAGEMLAESLAGIEQELVGAVFAEQRRIQRVDQPLAQKKGLRLSQHISVAARVGAPTGGQPPDAWIAAGRQGQRLLPERRRFVGAGAQQGI